MPVKPLSPFGAMDPNVLARIPEDALKRVLHAVQEWVAEQAVKVPAALPDTPAVGASHYTDVASGAVPLLSQIGSPPPGGWLGRDELQEYNVRLTRALKKENWLDGFVTALQVLFAVRP